MKEHFEMVVHSAEHISMLTKVLMMFSRRHMEVLSVSSQSQTGSSLYRIVFVAERDEANKLQLQINRAVDVLDTHLTYHTKVDVPIKRQRMSRVVPLVVS